MQHVTGVVQGNGDHRCTLPVTRQPIANGRYAALQCGPNTANMRLNQTAKALIDVCLNGGIRSCLSFALKVQFRFVQIAFIALKCFGTFVETSFGVAFAVVLERLEKFSIGSCILWGGEQC